MAFAVVNLVVALALNPWRADRLPDRFPAIVQDTLLILLFGAVATLILRDRILATTAVGAVVLGFALQDTLGNLFAGLAIQVERPFRVGDWVTIGGLEGTVREITWRATRMLTKAGNVVVVPNSVLAKDTITNYSVPTRHMRLQVEVGASYEVPPNVVKSVIVEALKNASELSGDRPAEVRVADFGASAIIYRVWFWVDDFDPDDRAQDQVRSLIYYAFKRNNITIPYPIQVEMSAEEGSVVPCAASSAPTRSRRSRCSLRCRREERAALLAVAKPVQYAAGEAIVRQGQAGKSLFVVVRGEASVTLAGTSGEVARLRARRRVRRDVAAHRRSSHGDGDSRDRLRSGRDRRRRISLGGAWPILRSSSTSQVSQQRDAKGSIATANRTPPPPTAVEIRQSLLARVRQFLRL